ncbi:MGH1-like glycoside hydrolase domain-containing protein [Pedobacter sp. KBW06]|uniref:MGH1-like glycoside hydrolase domain-containing protein n=1 Tax=Pedobacter sp. KBW06 TaxID=2153359 RepID=UPI0018F4464A|nr:trehalase family glycosidase [Pedobacter sp. KBW06]
MMSFIRSCCLCGFVLLASLNETKNSDVARTDFPDVLAMGFEVSNPEKIETNVFSDLGAWHAYTQPASAKDYGAFIGPLLMDLKGEWLGNTISKLQVKEAGKVIDLSGAKTVLKYYPGLLSQEMRINDLKVELQLIFVSNRSAVINTRVYNLAGKERKLQLSWTGESLLTNAQIKKGDKGIDIRFKDNEHRFIQQFNSPHKMNIQVSGNGYQADLEEIRIQPNAHFSIGQTQSYYLNAAEEPAATGTALNFNKEFRANQRRWDKYLNDYFNAPGLQLSNVEQQKLAVKSIVTLQTNWRSKSKDLLHDGVFPSLNYQGFYGFWSWDSWKQAVGLNYFNPALAKENMLAMFDYQDEHGMVADCIYTDKKENNWRDTKPPLAAWAAWKIYEQSKDGSFLNTIYPKLVKYHEWWYKNRDHNQNGLCEFGSTDGTRIAAAWESGMDNAVRFDKAVLLKNNETAWSLNQESVDLNAYLYAEKGYLAKIALVIGNSKAGQEWKSQLAPLKQKINRTFFREDKGFYYDKSLEGQWIDVDGPEGWLPLWCGLADKQQFNSVLKMIKKTNKFDTSVPLATLAADHPGFDPLKGYWRGPVWLDQFYFGYSALLRYGRKEEANYFLNKLLKNAEGLQGQGAIRENYHPLTGKGLNAKNFSWSAAHLLIILKENTHDTF